MARYEASLLRQFEDLYAKILALPLIADVPATAPPA
jgi:hypothetical protein